MNAKKSMKKLTEIQYRAYPTGSSRKKEWCWQQITDPNIWWTIHKYTDKNPPTHAGQTKTLEIFVNET